MTEACCHRCEKPLVYRPRESRLRFAKRLFCNLECRKTLYQEKRDAAIKREAWRPSESPGLWPTVTGEITADFRRFNIDIDDTLGSIPLRPATLVMKQSSVA